MADGSVVIDVDVNGKDVTGLNNQLMLPVQRIS